MKATYATVKSDAEYQKRKTLDSQLVKPPPAAKRARADENAQERTSALIEELLERETRQFCGQPPPPTQHPQAGPTDFSGLFPKAPGVAPLAQQPQRAARTFEDLASQRHSRHVLGELRPQTGYDLPSPRAPHTDATNAVGAAAAAAAARERQLPPSATAPVDWSLKTTVRFSSPEPFSIAEEAALLGSAASVQAQRAFASGEGVHGLSLQQQYLAATHSWQFPADAWPPPAPGTARPRAPPPELARRRHEWQTAFASAYDALRCGACDAFYYLSPEGSKKPFAAFFGAAGVGGRPRLHALLTRSTAGLRALMAGGLALGFAAPLLPAEADRREADQSAVPLDGSQSLLVFEGALRLHGLFDFLLNDSFLTHGADCDVPTLLAPTQFAHASLRALRPKVLGVSDARDPGRAQHRLELRGAALPPWVVHRLACVLGVTQAGSFSMACDTHPLTFALNWCPGAAAAAGELNGGSAALAGGACGAAAPAQQLTVYESRQRGCWDAEEAARWRHGAPGLSCNVVRELRCDGGTFTAKLAAKSAERVAM